ncbi:RING-H2 zinc finger protein RHA1a [Dendrobium catenatum]|uniref:RING-H2 zinc finger protein RHA1a n=1 Tax=Dendrobium catenatum TaxID=906689 RepID=A0A2I0W510_9ASPA|nr:RING-H2 zinc finger protein RHA1a [Dendrobium catenatum]
MKALKEMNYIDPSYVTTMTIVVLFLIIFIDVILYLFFRRSTAPPLLELTLETWSNYAEATRQDLRVASNDCCSICLANYDKEEEGEDNPLRFLPGYGLVFHARCVNPWLQHIQLVQCVDRRCCLDEIMLEIEQLLFY